MANPYHYDSPPFHWNEPFKRSERIMDVINTQQAHTGDTTQTSVHTYTLPAGTMGANGMIQIESLWSCTNNANSKTVRVKFGAATLKSQTMTSKSSGFFISTTFNRSSESSQVFMPSVVAAYGTSTTVITTPTIDTAADVVIDFTVQLNAVDSDDIALEAAVIKLMQF